MAFPTYTIDLLTPEGQRKLPTPQAGGTLAVIKSELTVTAAALVTGVVSRVLWVPAGFQLWGYSGKMADLDSGSALVWDLGWRDALASADDQNGIIAGSTVGQSAGALNTDDMAVAAFGYTFPYDTDITFTCTTQGSSSQAGACKFALIGEMP